MACIAKRRGKYIIDFYDTYGKRRWYDVKTAASNRRIDVGPSMITKLKEWKLACPPNALGLVFPNSAGNPINHNNLVNRLENTIFETDGSKMVAETKKEEMAQTITPQYYW